jgi:hypothetical protein
MFKVKLKENHDFTTTVYDVATDMRGILDAIMFMVYLENRWVWVNSSKWEPVE